MKSFIRRNLKKLIIAILCIALAGGSIYYFFFTNETVATTTTRAVEKGTIIVDVSGSGQVESAEQIEIKPKVSADITQVHVRNGAEVRKGDLLFTLDSTDAHFALENARISLAKIEQPADELDVTQANDTVTSAKEKLTQAYDSAFTASVNAFNDITTAINGLNDLFYANNTSPYFKETNVHGYGEVARSYRLQAGARVDEAKALFDSTRSQYQKTSKTSSQADIKKLVAHTYELSRALLQATKDTSVALDYVINNTDKTQRTNAMSTDQNNVANWTSKMTNHVSALLSAQTTIDSASRSINTSNLSLQKTQSGTDALDIASARLNYEQKQYTYSQYFIRAPFDGVIGNITVRKGDSASGSTALATMITPNYISHVSLNEVDAAKVKAGMPVIITFDAIPTLTATGTVIDVDTIGTVSQNVVSYEATISIESTDERIKPGMSTEATIIIEKSEQALIVPKTAVKQSNRGSYVEILGNDGVTLERIQVKTGISNDTHIEILEGLTEGQKVVTKTSGTSTSSGSQGASGTAGARTSGTRPAGVGMFGGGR